jgi:hypothetical protein
MNMWLKKPTFSFVLADAYNEQSKDSHGYSNTYSLDSRTLRHEYSSSGFLGGKDESKEVRVDDSKVATIKDKIKTLGYA